LWCSVTLGLPDSGFAQQLPQLFDMNLSRGLIANGDPDDVLIVQFGVRQKCFATRIERVNDCGVMGFEVNRFAWYMPKTDSREGQGERSAPSLVRRQSAQPATGQTECGLQ
jgi:hypothetical protein